MDNQFFRWYNKRQELLNNMMLALSVFYFIIPAFYILHFKSHIASSSHKVCLQLYFSYSRILERIALYSYWTISFILVCCPSYYLRQSQHPYHRLLYHYRGDSLSVARHHQPQQRWYYTYLTVGRQHEGDCTGLTGGCPHATVGSTGYLLLWYSMQYKGRQGYQHHLAALRGTHRR